MAPLVNPSRILHDVCAYWLTSSAGFNANATGHTASMPASTRPSATTCRLRPRALDITRTFYPTLRKLQSTPLGFDLLPAFATTSHTLLFRDSRMNPGGCNVSLAPRTIPHIALRWGTLPTRPFST